MTGDLTIRGITKPVELEVEFTGVAVDPFGATRAGCTAEAEISRKEFGLTWNAALETGGFLVSDKVKIDIECGAGQAGIGSGRHKVTNKQGQEEPRTNLRTGARCSAGQGGMPCRPRTGQATTPGCAERPQKRPAGGGGGSCRRP